jgi:hypothetical protein
VIIARADVEALLPDSLGWMWRRNQRYGEWERVCPWWGMPPYLIVFSTTIPLSPHFAVGGTMAVRIVHVPEARTIECYRWRRAIPWRITFCRELRRALRNAHNPKHAAEPGEIPDMPDVPASWLQWGDGEHEPTDYVAPTYRHELTEPLDTE